MLLEEGVACSRSDANGLKLKATTDQSRWSQTECKTRFFLTSQNGFSGKGRFRGTKSLKLSAVGVRAIELV